MNFRATQLFSFIAMVLYAAQAFREWSPVSLKLHAPILICAVLNGIFIFRSELLLSAVTYQLWLMFDILQILAFTYFLSKTESVRSIVKKYIFCFTAVALIGMFQQTLMLFGVNFFVAQADRVNGFSFEPSYYASYLLMGWVICAYLFEQETRSVMPIRHLSLCLLLITLALICSTSRMGYLFMGIYLAWRVLWLIFSREFTKNRIKKWLVILGGVGLVGGVLFLTVGVATGNEWVMYLFRGLGVGGAGDWSSGVRINSFMQTLQVFFNSPFLGVSLGGTDAAVAKLTGITITNADMGSYSMCVLAEVFAAWGVVGGALFLWYLIELCFLQYRDNAKYCKEEEKSPVKSVRYALIFELLILCLNQNILRPSLWTHIAVLCAIYAILAGRSAKEKELCKSLSTDGCC